MARKKERKIAVSSKLVEVANLDVALVLNSLQSSQSGLGSGEAKKRLAIYGTNEIVAEKKKNIFVRFLLNFRDPLTILLLVLIVVSFALFDVKTAVMLIAMLLLSVLLRFYQELKAENAVIRIKTLVQTTAKVMREGRWEQLPIKHLVPGDILELAAGDAVPADIRIIEAKNLLVNQATLTGESLPVEKGAEEAHDTVPSFDLPNICFMGSHIESGTARAVVVQTGVSTYFGALSERIIASREVSSFDLGVKKFTWLMVSFIVIFSPIIFLINGFTKGDWFQALFFALAIAVGMTPEMLPMIVMVNLSKGAVAMSKKQVIVKRLNAIQNFGAMDILCTDKTGTLTVGNVSLIKHVDILGQENSLVLESGYVNSYFQSGMHNMLDDAILEHDKKQQNATKSRFRKVDEVPFDFLRRRVSVVLDTKRGERVLYCKGAADETLAVCSRVNVGGKVKRMGPVEQKRAKELIAELGRDGYRTLAVAVNTVTKKQTKYTVKDEAGLTLLGFLAFMDPPKKSVSATIKALEGLGLGIKILTGDSLEVTKKICSEVGIAESRIVLGREIARVDEKQLLRLVEEHSIFAKLEPVHKELIAKALKKNGHVVGYLGDGINDTLALKVADVGISVEGAANVAKDSSDIVLLKKSLLVLKEGVVEGRKVFGNIEKYIKMAGSSNFGNMLALLGSSIFLPFIPMLPIQLVLNNLLYDVSQSTIPTDKVDDDYIEKPRKWKIGNLRNYIIFYGFINSLADYAVFMILMLVFGALNNAAFFQTGWFAESLITQTIIVHVLRTKKIPFVQSMASWPFILSGVLVVALGVYLPYSQFAGVLGFVALPGSFWIWLLSVVFGYMLLTQAVKRKLVSRMSD